MKMFHNNVQMDSNINQRMFQKHLITWKIQYQEQKSIHSLWNEKSQKHIQVRMACIVRKSISHFFHYSLIRMFWDTVHRLSVHFHIARGALYMALKITQPLLMYIWIFLLSVILEHTVMYMCVRSILTMYYFYPTIWSTQFHLFLIVPYKTKRW